MIILKLIDYVIKNDLGITQIKLKILQYETDMKEYLYDGYCPSAFSVLYETIYEKPYVPDIYEKDRCKYEDEND